MFDSSKSFFCFSVSGITGVVSIDENGDRNADYSLLDMDPKSGIFEVTTMSIPPTLECAMNKFQVPSRVCSRGAGARCFVQYYSLRRACSKLRLPVAAALILACLSSAYTLHTMEN